jgi:hypothetical protein
VATDVEGGDTVYALGRPPLLLQRAATPTCSMRAAAGDEDVDLRACVRVCLSSVIAFRKEERRERGEGTQRWDCCCWVTLLIESSRGQRFVHVQREREEEEEEEGSERARGWRQMP